MKVELNDHEKDVLKDFVDTQLEMLTELSEGSEFDETLIGVLTKLSNQLKA